MEDKNELVDKFKRLTQHYEELRKQHEQQVDAILQSRREIAWKLVQSGLTHQQVGKLLDLSAGRVGQLVKGAAGYVPQRYPGE